MTEKSSEYPSFSKGRALRRMMVTRYLFREDQSHNPNSGLKKNRRQDKLSLDLGQDSQVKATLKEAEEVLNKRDPVV